MNAVITFDLSEPEVVEIVRQRLRVKGYNVFWSVTTNNVTTPYSLPHNMIWKQNVDLLVAKNDLIAEVEFLQTSRPNLRLLRCIVLNSTPWSGINGVPVFIQ